MRAMSPEENPPEYYATFRDEKIARWLDAVGQLAAELRDAAKDERIEEISIMEDEVLEALNRIEKRCKAEASFRRRNGNG